TVVIDPLQEVTTKPTLPRQQAPIATTTAAPLQTQKDIVLTTTPATLILSASQEKTILLNIASPGNKVTGNEIHLKFNPKVISIKEIFAGDFLANPLRLAKQIDNQKGEVVYTIGTLQPSEGSGVLAKVVINAKDAGTTQISLGNTIVTAENQRENTVKSWQGTTVTVQ
ncbi:MAG: hypothetical protein HYW33_02130, partial [Candidatus Blackburnbacteria bacterium]|nr:hypothetical protein [Candidatus Blackburnbacteria bacterium]